MCKAPITLPNGIMTACHECSQCRQQSINDWVGRNIAESKTAVASSAITLTYGKGAANDADHERAAILTYSDVQKYIKLLRRHGYPMRYFVAGEYGSKKGRAHWHLIAYWQDKVPDHELRKNFMEEHWPHGWSFWDQVNPHTAMYVAKYVQKTMGDDMRQGHLSMSKKPPLGTEYFRQVAEAYVQQGLAPQNLEYTFAGVNWWNRDGTKEPWRFRLKDRPAEMYLQHYVDTWRATYPGQHVPNSELVEEFLDPGAWKEHQSDVSRPLTREETRSREPKNPMIRQAYVTADNFDNALRRTEAIIARQQRDDMLADYEEALERAKRTPGMNEMDHLMMEQWDREDAANVQKR